MHCRGRTHAAASSQRDRAIVGHPYQVAEISHAAENEKSRNHGSEHTDSDHRPSLGSPRSGDVTIGYQS
jgi:hypothetical protein